jgi:hypothetical protein
MLFTLWHARWKPDTSVTRLWHTKQWRNSGKRHAMQRNQWSSAENCVLCGSTPIVTSCNNKESVEAVFSVGTVPRLHYEEQKDKPVSLSPASRVCLKTGRLIRAKSRLQIVLGCRQSETARRWDSRSRWCCGRRRSPQRSWTRKLGNLRRWNRNQATCEDTADWEHIVRAIVNCSVCELATTLYVLVVTICKRTINPITNPNPVYSHSIAWQYCLLKGETLPHTSLPTVLVYLHFGSFNDAVGSWGNTASADFSVYYKILSLRLENVKCTLLRAVVYIRTGYIRNKNEKRYRCNKLARAGTLFIQQRTKPVLWMEHSAVWTSTRYEYYSPNGHTYCAINVFIHFQRTAL